MKTERELFEEAFKKVNSGVSFWLNTWSDEDNDYGHLTASWGWHMWLASANRQGYRLVPVEPTQEMIDKAVCDTPETPSQDYWHSGQPISDDQAIACYKAMIGAAK